jgi:hypothetical protein
VRVRVESTSGRSLDDYSAHFRKKMRSGRRGANRQIISYGSFQKRREGIELVTMMSLIRSIARNPQNYFMQPADAHTEGKPYVSLQHSLYVSFCQVIRPLQVDGATQMGDELRNDTAHDGPMRMPTRSQSMRKGVLRSHCETSRQSTVQPRAQTL